MEKVEFPGNHLIVTVKSGNPKTRNLILSKLIPSQYENEIMVDDEAFFLPGIANDLRDSHFMVPAIDFDTHLLVWAVQENVYKVKTAEIYPTFELAIDALRKKFE